MSRHCSLCKGVHKLNNTYLHDDQIWKLLELYKTKNRALPGF